MTHFSAAGSKMTPETITKVKGCGGVRNDCKTHIWVKEDARTFFTSLFFGPAIKVKNEVIVLVG